MPTLAWVRHQACIRNLRQKLPALLPQPALSHEGFLPRHPVSPCHQWATRNHVQWDVPPLPTGFPQTHRFDLCSNVTSLGKLTLPHLKQTRAATVFYPLILPPGSSEQLLLPDITAVFLHYLFPVLESKSPREGECVSFLALIHCA